VELGVLVDVLEDTGLPAMAQVDLGSRQNRHQPLWDLTRMSSTVLRAMARRVRVPAPELPAAGSAGAGAMLRPETYVHAVATEDGLRLEEHLNPLTERPPIARVLPGREWQTVA
jgi:glucosyl-3-phosphoglycerate synthase